MKGILVAFVLSFAVCHLSQAQTDSATNSGFRELLEIAEIKPEALSELAVADAADVDWNTLAQVLLRMQQQSENDLRRWTLSSQSFSSKFVGELFEVEGLVTQVEMLSLPPEIAERLETKQVYRCHFKDNKSRELTVLTIKIPRSWDFAKPLMEPISFRGVLLRSGDAPSFLATHLRWLPTAGAPTGKLLLARQGMDAALWDEVVQRSRFVSPDKGREAEAFYAVLAALKKVSPAELTQLVNESIAREQTVSDSVPTKLQQQLAASVAEQAERGLSSFAAIYLEPQKRVGELVRFEGVARRAVRIDVKEEVASAARSPVREYFELEVFPPDSQNLPLVCCVTSLPAGFPLGDAIHTQVRLEGVFFKSWQYRSRKVVTGQGETGTQQQRYTPVIMAATLTWLQDAPTGDGWWGLAVGGAIFSAMIFGLVRMAMSFKQERRGRQLNKPPDFSEL